MTALIRSGVLMLIEIGAANAQAQTTMYLRPSP
jgi:hypothetical protein